MMPENSCRRGCSASLFMFIRVRRTDPNMPKSYHRERERAGRTARELRVRLDIGTRPVRIVDQNKTASARVRNRRGEPAPRPREGPLTELIAGTRPRPQERMLMPQRRPLPEPKIFRSRRVSRHSIDRQLPQSGALGNCRSCAFRRSKSTGLAANAIAPPPPAVARLHVAVTIMTGRSGNRCRKGRNRRVHRLQLGS